MEDKKHIQEELQELSPFLSKLKSDTPKDGFEVPPAYFRQLTDELLDKSQAKPTASSENFAWWQRWTFWLQPKYVGYGLAAILLLIAIPLFFLPQHSAPEDVSSEDALMYVEANLSDFDTELLLLEVDRLDGAYYDIPQDEVEEYLRENMSDWSIEELETLF